ncbi:FAD-binding and (Fe-S)-binding domain-containing protein [Tenggerimyces flavus]|uniref:FAD-binding and (Fe-S)-binding domain-containing protein n=1 Tax=Tenggerimyces flavus TaxID=1708749 RepID=A0ABV7YMZ0_9ACTN|nr:FAD-linked oxidase C-terminal domain-containing protein [Tenggerimyces flavus]MBM7790204.1 FAD/FMN-containing dehydrogenase/Fe-S oxidoreductase [Tenggerimyces flavus]
MSERLDRAGLEARLRQTVGGTVRFDVGALAVYSCDSSNYRQVPVGVVIPHTVDAGVAAVAVCRAFGVPVLSRGGGTSLAGQTTNNAIVIDWTKHCHRLASVDVEAATCVVEPGITLDDLNTAQAGVGLMFGPRPSTHQSCTIGGMVGNNSCGATAQAYGKTVDNVRRLEVLTYDGERMWVGPTSDAEYQAIAAGGGRRADIYSALRELRDRYLGDIRTGYPSIPRRVSGYNLDSLLPEAGFNLAKALVGSEGTLVTVLHAELALENVPVHKTMVVLGYSDIVTAGRAVPRILPHRPWQFEGMDDVLIHLEQAETLASTAIHRLPAGQAWLMVQFAGDSPDEARTAARHLIDDVCGDDPPTGPGAPGDPMPTVEYIDNPAREAELIEVREAGLGATAHPSAKHATWEGWEDSAVAPDDLGDYLRDLRALLDEFGFDDSETALYGHFGQGCVHTRIPFELRTADGIAHYRRFVERAADLVVGYGGSLSGEHGDGQSRGELLTKMFGRRLVRAFGELKAIFDPGNMMNPGKVVDPNPLDSHLRLGTEFAPLPLSTHFAYPKDDGQFAKAAMRCVGVGKCRQSGADPSDEVMCPSYMVTRDEDHSPRGRSRLLFEMVRGEVIPGGWRSAEVRDALDLCLACKGCKVDCPVNVDVATYKAEFLSHHYAGRLRPAAHYSMGWLPLWSRLANAAPGLPRVVNALTRAPGLAGVIKRIGGIDQRRDVPRFAPQPFTTWWRARNRPSGQTYASRGPVVLWPDTFSNYFHTSIARSAVAVLEDAGFEVLVPPMPVCCGLTWISTGQLKTARKVLLRTIRALRNVIRAGIPMVGLEPSCLAVFRADASELVPGNDDIRRLSKQSFTLAELLRSRAADWVPPHIAATALVQTHRHEHAVLDPSAEVDLLKRVGVDAERLPSGCCGLAGNFGFERGHYEVSMAAGERVLLPRVRSAPADTVVLADGFSCRTQIDQGGTGRYAVHLAELLATALTRSTSPQYEGLGD